VIALLVACFITSKNYSAGNDTKITSFSVVALWGLNSSFLFFSTFSLFLLASLMVKFSINGFFAVTIVTGLLIPRRPFSSPVMKGY
jgi:hypothetical protein